MLQRANKRHIIERDIKCQREKGEVEEKEAERRENGEDKNFK